MRQEISRKRFIYDLWTVNLIFLFVFFAFSVVGVHANFLVVLFQGCEVFASFRELAFLHSFADVPESQELLSKRFEN